MIIIDGIQDEDQLDKVLKDLDNKNINGKSNSKYRNIKRIFLTRCDNCKETPYMGNNQIVVIKGFDTSKRNNFFYKYLKIDKENEQNDNLLRINNVKSLQSLISKIINKYSIKEEDLCKPINCWMLSRIIKDVSDRNRISRQDSNFFYSTFIKILCEVHLKIKKKYLRRVIPWVDLLDFNINTNGSGIGIKSIINYLKKYYEDLDDLDERDERNLIGFIKLIKSNRDSIHQLIFDFLFAEFLLESLIINNKKFLKLMPSKLTIDIFESFIQILYNCYIARKYSEFNSLEIYSMDHGRFEELELNCMRLYKDTNTFSFSVGPLYLKFESKIHDLQNTNLQKIYLHRWIALIFLIKSKNYSKIHIDYVIDLITNNGNMPYYFKKLNGLSFKGRDLFNIDFSYANLSNLDFSGLKISNTDFGNSSLDGATFCNADIENCSFVMEGKPEKVKIDFQNSIIINCNYTGIRCLNSFTNNSIFINCIISDSGFENSHFCGSNFYKVDFSDSRFENTKLNFSNFLICDFSPCLYDQKPINQIFDQKLKNQNLKLGLFNNFLTKREDNFLFLTVFPKPSLSSDIDPKMKDIINKIGDETCDFDKRIRFVGFINRNE